VTHVVRGRDLYEATAVHRLLQELIGLPAPVYHHHRLVLDESGKKLAKSTGSTALQALRKSGATPADIRRRIGLE
jgi:glutamyl-Q tRNA(Asp) synthetase